MNFLKKKFKNSHKRTFHKLSIFKNLFLLILLACTLSSCDEGCVEAYEFDSESFYVPSNPDDVIGDGYNDETGGQVGLWIDTKLKSSGEEFIILISGAWSPVGGDRLGLKTSAFQECTFCSKKSLIPAGGTAGDISNCLCHNNQESESEYASSSNPRCSYDKNLPESECQNKVVASDGSQIDCSIESNQNSLGLCTCKELKNLDGDNAVFDDDVYHFALNYYNKTSHGNDSNFGRRLADNQVPCKYTKGMGAKIRLAGKDGNTIPQRAYHLYTQEEICNIDRDSQGKCIDANGNDITKYFYRSPNSRIFMKDDNSGNDGSDTNTLDDEYHGYGEKIHVIIDDNYYADNVGGYNLTFLKGVASGGGKKAGVIEFLVELVEDIILGEFNVQTKEREGGIIEFMYNAIVKDYGFAQLVQVSLILYISIYGGAYLMGVAEFSRKEVLQRVIKIGLIIFFVSPDSWQFYDKFVVSFFKDGMDFMVSMIMDFSDKNIDPNSGILMAQIDRAEDYSNATRFSYVDAMISKLLSKAVAKKIFGLFFGEYFGLLCIPAFYALIAYFIYVMILVAAIYMTNLLKMVFVLSLGPIFIIFTLFGQTRQMFRNWVGFLGGRFFEVLVLFMVLYNFLAIIDRKFTSLLSFRACTEQINLGLIRPEFYKSYANLSFIEWMAGMLTIAGLIFITNAIIDKLGQLSGYLFKINIDGGDAKSGSQSAAGFVTGAGSMSGAAAAGVSKLFGSGLKNIAQKAGKYGAKALVAAVGSRPFAALSQKIGSKIPFRGLRRRAADSVIDKAIKNAQKEVNDKYKGSSVSKPEIDKEIRARAMEILQDKLHRNRTAMSVAGVNHEAIARRFDKKLVQEPLKNFMKERAKQLKSQGNENGEKLLGKDLSNQLLSDAAKWAKENLTGVDRERIEAMIKDKKSLKSVFDSASSYSSSEAAKAFGGNEEYKNRYLQHLKEKEFEMHDKKAQKETALGRLGTDIAKFGNSITRKAAKNPKMARENFLRKSKNFRRKCRRWCVN